MGGWAIPQENNMQGGRGCVQVGVEDWPGEGSGGG